MYEDTIDALDRSFTRDQLANLVTQLLSRSPSRQSRKRDVMDIILTKVWGLKTPTQVEREQREQTEIKKQGEDASFSCNELDQELTCLPVCSLSCFASGIICAVRPW